VEVKIHNATLFSSYIFGGRCYYTTNIGTKLFFTRTHTHTHTKDALL